MKTLVCFLMLALAGAALADVNVTGNWSGSFNISRPDGQSNDSTAFLKLKQSGNEITGSVRPNEGEQFAIQKGKIEGDKITLEANQEGRTIKFDLVLANEHIIGEANMSGANGESAKAQLDVTRVK